MKKRRRHAAKPHLAQYRELAAFAQFGSDLDKASQEELNRGPAPGRRSQSRVQYAPLSVEKQILILAGTREGLARQGPVRTRSGGSSDERELPTSMKPRAWRPPSGRSTSGRDKKARPRHGQAHREFVKASRRPAQKPRPS